MGLSRINGRSLGGSRKTAYNRSHVTSDLSVTGEVQLESSVAGDTGSVNIAGPVATMSSTSYSLKMPPAIGTAGQNLAIDDASTGELKWASASGGGATIITTKADGATMTTAESGGTVLQSTSGATINLPALSAGTGIQYTFIWAAAAGGTFEIAPQSGDRIAGSVMDVATGNAVTAAGNGSGFLQDGKALQLDSGSKYGDRVTLVSGDSVAWYITHGLGSWVFES